jgi:hypothetical protein
MAGQYYVDKREFYDEIVVYKKKKKKNPNTPIPNCLAEKILKICTGVMLRYNFNKYSYREEMVGDAVVFCTKYFDNFNEEKYDNPYGYFWAIAYHAGLRRIGQEKKQQAIRAKKIQEQVVFDEMFDDPEMEDYKEYVGSFFNFDLEEYEESINLKKSKDKKNKEKRNKENAEAIDITQTKEKKVDE